MEPGSPYRIHKGSPIIPVLSRINPIPRIDTDFFRIHSNIPSRLRLGPHKGLHLTCLTVIILKALLPSTHRITFWI